MGNRNRPVRRLPWEGLRCRAVHRPFTLATDSYGLAIRLAFHDRYTARAPLPHETPRHPKRRPVLSVAFIHRPGRPHSNPTPKRVRLPGATGRVKRHTVRLHHASRFHGIILRHCVTSIATTASPSSGPRSSTLGRYGRGPGFESLAAGAPVSSLGLKQAEMSGGISTVRGHGESELRR
jgi:hypothetical protein